MKASFFVSLLAMAAAVVGSLRAEDVWTTQLARAAAMNDRGDFRATLALVEPLLRAQDHAPDSVQDHAQDQNPERGQVGVLWNLRGVALQNLGDRDQARRSYENALRMLRGAPDLEKQFASALNNLGSLEAEAGHPDESKSLRSRARQVYASVGDRAGVARVWSNLALVSMEQGKEKEARRELAAAFKEESMLRAPDGDDVAGMWSAQALLDARKGDYRAAATEIEHAIELWTNRYGPHYYLLAAGLSLRGKARMACGDAQAAVDDLARALHILEDNGLKQSAVYLLTKVSYADVLRAAGRRDEAARTRSEAQTALKELRSRSCGGCTVSAESLR